MLINPSMLLADGEVDDDATNEVLDLFEPGFDPTRADFVGPMPEAREVEIDVYGNLWICHGYTMKPLQRWPMPRTIQDRHDRPRRALHRAFFRWLRQYSLSFSIPLAIGRRTDAAIEFSFRGMNPVIKGAVVRDGLFVSVEWNGKLWDFLVDYDAVPRRQLAQPRPGRLGFYCMLCRQDDRKTYASRYQLWCDEVFKPFLSWVNGDLAHARQLGIHGRHGSSWAELLKDSGCALT
jgi:hypothetical protein